MQDRAICFTTAPCALGWLLVAGTARGVCKVSLGDDAKRLDRDWRREHPDALLGEDRRWLAPWVEALRDHLAGRGRGLELPLDVRGGPFQRSVWDAIRAIPYGQTRSYGELARALGRPSAARAVAGACAANPVALLVPCHRVVRGDRSPGGYRWGLARKRALLEHEARVAQRAPLASGHGRARRAAVRASAAPGA